jgi:hypothetical protein
VWHPSFLTLLLDALPAHWDELLRDVKYGGCRRARALSVELRRAVDSPAEPLRADELRRAGFTDVHAIWPRLCVVSCWGDGQANMPMADLRRRLPRAVFQPKGLLATEAFISIPFGGWHPAAVASHFLEFVDEHGIPRLVHELRFGERYEVVVSTGGGLWRYRLGDLVEVDGFIGAVPSLRFLGRVGNVSDLCGEKLAEPFVTSAIDAACTTLGFSPGFAMLAPDADADTSSYTLFAEGNLPPGLAAELDRELRKNPHYSHCRDLGQLGPPRCFEIARGAYETFCAVESAARQRIGTIKPRALSVRTDWRSHLACTTPTNPCSCNFDISQPGR